MPDHIHMCLSIPPRYAVSNIVGYLKGKSAISIARQFKGRQRNFEGEAYWARGYYVSTVSLDEEMIKEYIRNKEKNDVNRDQLKLRYSFAFGAYFSLTRASFDKLPVLPEVI